MRIITTDVSLVFTSDLVGGYNHAPAMHQLYITNLALRGRNWLPDMIDSLNNFKSHIHKVLEPETG